jgi:epoxyqueuosine reductase
VNAKQLSEFIKTKAKDLGFANCGISKAGHLTEDEDYFTDWIQAGKHAQMTYLQKNTEKRLDPTKLHTGTKSVISVLYNYYPVEFQNTDCSYKISKYAYGKDYHKVLKKKLQQLLKSIEEIKGQANARIFVDSAPVLERRWAQKSGLGWIGKNTLLINPESGSYFFLGEILIDLDLAYDNDMNDQCGSCTACLRACPTHALDITKPYEMDAALCISYQTIEETDKSSFSSENKSWIFGCDICQEVCPWNRKAPKTNEPKFQISGFIKNATNEDWENLDEDRFEKHFSGTPIRRAKFEGLMKNIEKANENKRSS